MSSGGRTLRLHERLCSVQLEEVRSVPASSEKIIAEASAQKEELEKKKLVEEQKLAQVMESLKEETSGLQEDKEVRECLSDAAGACVTPADTLNCAETR